MKFFVCFAALCCVFMILSDQYQGGTALRKKKILKKLKDFLPLLLALKGKKKFFILPIPVPFNIGKKGKESWPVNSWPVSSVSDSSPISYISETMISSAHNSPSWPAPQMPAPQMPVKTSIVTPVVASYQAPLSYQTPIKNTYSPYLTTYVVKDGPGINYGKNSDNYQYKINHNKQQVYGQPLVIDEYEQGKGVAPIYKTENPVYQRNNQIVYETIEKNNQNSVSTDYSNPTYTDNGSGTYHKIKNDVPYEEVIIKNGDYSSNQENVNSNYNKNYDENSDELINENINVKESNYNNNSAVRNVEYKKSKA